MPLLMNDIHYKSPSEIEAMKEAGRVSAKALRKVGELIEPGISTLELDHQAEALIRFEGGRPAFKGYGGFPGSICCSINDMIVHGIPRADYYLQEGDIVSIDTGAIIDGWVGDNAQTFPCGKVSEEALRLLETTENCMWAGIEQACDGKRFGDIGHAIQRIAESAGYGVVREYVGHGVGRDMHEDPSVPNYGRAGSGIKLKTGLVIAIEPMINIGTHKTIKCKDGWGVKTRDGKLSAHFERTIAITEDGPIVLTKE